MLSSSHVTEDKQEYWVYSLALLVFAQAPHVLLALVIKMANALLAPLLVSEAWRPLLCPHLDLWNISFNPQNLASLATKWVNRHFCGSLVEHFSRILLPGFFFWATNQLPNHDTETY